MKRKPIKPIATQMDPVLALGLERARGALYMERLQRAAMAACAAVREAVAKRRIKRRRKKGGMEAQDVSVPQFLRRGTPRGCPRKSARGGSLTDTPRAGPYCRYKTIGG